MSSEQKVSSNTTDDGVSLIVRGLGSVPSFKNSKRAIQKPNGQLMPVTEKRVKGWMQAAIASFASQLLCGSATSGRTTLTAAQLHSLIVSLPHDDCWTAIPVLVVTSQKCEPGEEGATITVTPI